MELNSGDSDRIFSKLDAIGKSMAVLEMQMPAASIRLEDHEQRLRSMEARLWTSVGALVLLAFAVPLVINFLLNNPTA